MPKGRGLLLLPACGGGAFLFLGCFLGGGGDLRWCRGACHVANTYSTEVECLCYRYPIRYRPPIDNWCYIGHRTESQALSRAKLNLPCGRQTCMRTTTTTAQRRRYYNRPAASWVRQFDGAMHRAQIYKYPFWRLTLIRGVLCDKTWCDEAVPYKGVGVSRTRKLAKSDLAR